MKSSFLRLKARQLALAQPRHVYRTFSSSPSVRQAGKSAEAPSSPGLNSRWLSDFQAQLKQASEGSASSEKKVQVETLKQDVDSRWLDLLAGSEGFLTSPEWRGLDHHAVAWGDMDSMGHVNNVIYNKYAESARVEWVRKFTALAAPEHKQQWADLMTPRNIGLIMRSIKTEYKLPVTYPDRVTVLHKLAMKPDYTSDALFFDVLIVSEAHKRIAARCFEDIVVYDYRSAKRTPLEPCMVDRLRETYEMQEKNKKQRQEEVKELFGALAMIESSI